MTGSMETGPRQFEPSTAANASTWQCVLTAKELPARLESIASVKKPRRARLRSEVGKPKSAVSVASKEDTEPKRARPNAARPDPSQARLRIKALLPIIAKSKTSDTRSNHPRLRSGRLASTPRGFRVGKGGPSLQQPNIGIPTSICKKLLANDANSKPAESSAVDNDPEQAAPKGSSMTPAQERLCADKNTSGFAKSETASKDPSLRWLCSNVANPSRDASDTKRGNTNPALVKPGDAAAVPSQAWLCVSRKGSACPESRMDAAAPGLEKLRRNGRDPGREPSITSRMETDPGRPRPETKAREPERECECGNEELPEWPKSKATKTSPNLEKLRSESASPTLDKSDTKTAKPKRVRDRKSKVVPR